MKNIEYYHGWTIEITSLAMGYSFRCLLVDINFVVSDEQIYSTYQQALRAAWLRADLESVKLSLTHFLNGKLQRLFLTTAERMALENSISQVVNSASGVK